MKLKYLIESYSHKINIYPIITIIYDDEIQGEYEFSDAGKTVDIKVCISPEEGQITDKVVQPYMDDVKFDGISELQDEALEKFKNEKFIVDPDNLATNKIQFKTDKGWEYAEDEEEEE